MQSGVFTKDNFDALMRSWSQRRHNGEVEIHLGERIVRVVFYQGKIVECSEDGIRPAHEVRTLLDREAPESAADEETYGDVWQSFESAGGVSPDQMRAAIRKRVLDKLHALEFGPGAFYTLRLEMPFFERDWAPQISVGALLLDLVDAADILKKWPGVVPDGALFTLVPPPAEGGGAAPGSADEKLIIERLATPSNLVELGKSTLLPIVHLERALLVLLDRGVVTAGAAKPEPGPGPVEETPASRIAETSSPVTVSPAAEAEPASAPTQTAPGKNAPVSAPESVSAIQAEQQLRIIWPQTDADRRFASIAVVVLGAIAGIGAWLDFTSW